MPETQCDAKSESGISSIVCLANLSPSSFSTLPCPLCKVVAGTSCELYKGVRPTEPYVQRAEPQKLSPKLRSDGLLPQTVSHLEGRVSN
jgi:hypothetical protein